MVWMCLGRGKHQREMGSSKVVGVKRVEAGLEGCSSGRANMARSSPDEAAIQ